MVFIVISPLLGFFPRLAVDGAHLAAVLPRHARRLDRWFRRLQHVSAALYSQGHGGNDAQKSIGSDLVADRLQVFTCHRAGTRLGGE